MQLKEDLSLLRARSRELRKEMTVSIDETYLTYWTGAYNFAVWV